MATHNTGWMYAKNVHAQINPNKPKRINWKNTSNAVGNNDKYASSEFSVKKVKAKNKEEKDTIVKNYPYTVTAHNYGLNIPSNAYIKKVEFQVSMKVTSKKAKVDFPRGLFCVYGGGYSKHLDNTKKRETGWHNGLFMYNPKKDMSTSFTIKSYTMEEADVVKGKFSANDFNDMVMGIDLIFDDLADVSCDVYLRWVRIRVTYDIPEYTLIHNGANTTQSNPRKIKTGSQYTVKYTLKQGTKAKGGSKQFKLNVPFGTEIISTNVSKGTFSNNTWNVNPDGESNGVTLTVKYKDYTVNKQKISLTGVVSKDFWYESSYGNVEDYATGSVQVDADETPHQRSPLCFVAVTKAESSLNNQVTYNLHTNFNYNTFGSTGNLLNVEIDPNSSDDNVTLVSSTNDTIIVNIPEDAPTNIAFRFCLKPVNGTNGDVYLTVGDLSTNHAKFRIKPPYEYHLTTNRQAEDEENNICNNILNKETLIFSNHRIASNLNTGAYILPCAVKEHDSVMVQGKSNIHMYKFEEIDYFGCIPLERPHFDPKSSYKDKLLDFHYKNKRYMGKELASDEDIDLNLRLRPPQVTTVQGLIDIDKPIPINANHRCFEGDALNHRGWAEVYGIEAERTNPHWYKCKIQVKYLTHNLNTRFKINRGDRTFNYPIPSILTETVSSGDSIGDNRDTDLFTVETDGGYIYNEVTSTIDTWFDENGNSVTWSGDGTTYTYTNDDGDTVTLTGEEIISYIELLGNVIDTPVVGSTLKVVYEFDADETHRNIVTLDEGQHVIIKSKNTLSTQSQVSFNWSSSKLDENKENAISRITRLIDKTTNNPVFEYEYSDFDFSNYSEEVDVEHQTLTGSLSCHVTGRKLVKGNYIEELNKDIDIHIDLTDNENTEEEEEEQSYGSNLTFSLNGNRLTVDDTGFNGKEVHQEFELEGNEYYWETEWKNNNTDGQDADITSYFDIVFNDTLLSSKFAVDYSKMYISPFPVSDKTILFTRNAEEGVIYYLQDNQEEFSYLLDPYYQYHNGVDLRDSNGTSILNLNYGYKIVYLQNGLVSLGVNRLNGQLYLGKYDPVSKEYIPTHIFQLTIYDDININTISDDKIELQASNTTISMYRGHPYVIIKHPLEDIQVVSSFNKIWGENIGDQVSEYPVYFDLLNSSNLLPKCVGGTKTIDKSCITVSEVETDLVEGNIEITPDEHIYQSVASNFSVSGDLESGDVIHFLVNGDEVGHVSYPDTFSYTFDDGGAYEVTAVYVGNSTRAYSVSPAVTVHVEKVVPEEEGSGGSSSGGSSSLSGEWKLTMTSPKTFYYLDGSKITFRLTKGGTGVSGQTVERALFTGTASGDTDSKGYLYSYNSKSTYHPKKYKIGAKLYIGGKFVTSVWQDVVIKKANTEWEIVHGATGRNDKTFTAKLKNKHTGKAIAGKKVVVYVNGKKYNKKTNKNGNISLKMKSGTYTYKLSFAGDKDYNNSKKNYKERVVK